jgi:flagellar assembly factor FliW
MNELRMTTARETSGILASEFIAAQPASEEKMIDTRFGKVKLVTDNPISFPMGILGFPTMTKFCLLNFPVEKFSKFRLLQSLEDETLSFITFPLEGENIIIEANDLKEASREVDIDIADLSVLLIVSVHRTDQLVRLSVNARAPIMISTSGRTGFQHVFPRDKYKIQHFISAGTPATDTQ